MIKPKHNFINNKLFSPSGRITRKPFFFIQLSLSVPYILSMLPTLLGISMYKMAVFHNDYPVISTILTGIYLTLSVGILIIWIFSLFKRCRDAGLSLLWLFLLLVPYVGLVLLLILCFKGSIPLPQASDAQNLENKNQE